MKKAADYRAYARENLKGKWGGAIVACLIVSMISGLLAWIPGVGYIATILLEGPLIIGLLIYFSKLNKKESPEIEVVFDGLKNDFVNNFVTYLLVSIFTALWSLLFIIPGIIKSYSYSMAMFIRTKEPEITATDAITLSRSIMNGKKWKLFCLQLSFIGWTLLCLLTFGIGYFFLSPYVQASTVAFYEDAYNEFKGISEEIIVTPEQIEQK